MIQIPDQNLVFSLVYYNAYLTQYNIVLLGKVLIVRHIIIIITLFLSTL